MSNLFEDFLSNNVGSSISFLNGVESSGLALILRFKTIKLKWKGNPFKQIVVPTTVIIDAPPCQGEIVEMRKALLLNHLLPTSKSARNNETHTSSSCSPPPADK